MSRLSPAQFVERAIRHIPVPNTQNPHKGVRKSVLVELFQEYFGESVSFDEALNELIVEGKVVAFQIVWKARPANVARYNWRSTYEKVTQLYAFPDTKVEETDPMLYLPDSVPGKLQARVNRKKILLAKITGPQD